MPKSTLLAAKHVGQTSTPTHYHSTYFILGLFRIHVERSNWGSTARPLAQELPPVFAGELHPGTPVSTTGQAQPSGFVLTWFRVYGFTHNRNTPLLSAGSLLPNGFGLGCPLGGFVGAVEFGEESLSNAEHCGQIYLTP